MSAAAEPVAARPPVAVTYDGLPISSGGAHSLGRLSRREAYARTTSFLRTCTEPAGPREYWFAVNSVPELRPVRRLEKELERRFGKREGFLWIKDQRLDIAAERVAEALDFLDEIDPQPTNRWGMAPIWFWVTTKFRILDPATGQPLPGQDPDRYRGNEYEWGLPLGTSSLRLILHNRAQLGINLCIPDADDDLLRRAVPWLQQHLPCRLSQKHWTAWTPTRSGSFKARRMNLPNSTES